MGRPKGSRSKTDDAKAFVARVEAMLRASKKPGSENLERLACRFVTGTGKNLATAGGVWRSLMAYKYGQPKESQETTHKIQVELSVSDADAIIRSYLVLTSGEADRASESDSLQAAQQDRKLLPS